ERRAVVPTAKQQPSVKVISAKFLEQRRKHIFRIQKSPLGGGWSDRRSACSAKGLPGPSPPSLPCPESYVPTPGGDACVLGVVEKAGNALYSARVYVELGRRLAHAHAARIRDRRTLGPL